MELKIEITDYFSEDEIKEIAEQELRAAFREQFRNEADVERVIVNLSLEYVYSLVAEQWDGDFNELLRDKVREAIEQGVHFYVSGARMHGIEVKVRRSLFLTTNAGTVVH